jgi:peroxiredoxin Q/BCP
VASTSLNHQVEVGSLSEPARPSGGAETTSLGADLPGDLKSPGEWQNFLKTIQMKITKGSKIPAFRLKDQDGNWLDINDLIEEKNLVIYFYPKDDTPGCTKEACSFRDQFEDFKDVGAEVTGISADSVESHRQFADKHRLKFRLLSDTDNQVRKAFGVPAGFLGLLPGRVTYIVDKTGTVQHIINSQLDATKHVTEALKILKEQ